MRGRLSSGRLSGEEEVGLILQLQGAESEELTALLRRKGARHKAKFQNLNAQAISIPASALDELAALDEVESVTPDREVRWLGHVDVTTGAGAAARQQSVNSGLNGKGIGIAVLDSGIYAAHGAFLTSGSYAVNRVVVNQDFTGENITGDRYGYGSHVASIAAGLGSTRAITTPGSLRARTSSTSAC